ncbi:hypothetical protein, conserved [Thermococcus kodakarensis KOD1]|uniref:Uncharacterized protein n=1 Tax=Thermococcus kodakarensis (strain ATCC BAA-918 / JCM 12380 / KOD1) TaxID=69014 RepID=Q5JGY6_THEKO|nr:hypothetical protein [Thermococcus kodakarensis]WCN27348.1 hypothetical protein POG15_06955 [Thermococcus kodakarensis]WCN29637.1 hypothetical protein POG21_06950 [Thermococcus kodakarensis]BAD85558.1 hypothetical protein, conserved [Thermococcus kodakarensis KOD1]
MTADLEEKLRKLLQSQKAELEEWLREAREFVADVAIEEGKYGYNDTMYPPELFEDALKAEVLDEEIEDVKELVRMITAILEEVRP